MRYLEGILSITKSSMFAITKSTGHQKVSLNTYEEITNTQAFAG
jgi:hypothetical protein